MAKSEGIEFLKKRISNLKVASSMLKFASEASKNIDKEELEALSDLLSNFLADFDEVSK